jgi:hypothetical protein
MVNDNWKAQGPSYQLPARDVGFRLLGRRFSADTQSVSIKIIRPAQILAVSCQKAWERVKSEDRRLLLSSIVIWLRLRPDLPAIAQPVIYSSRSLDLLRPWLDRTSRRCAVYKNVDGLQQASTGNKQAR